MKKIFLLFTAAALSAGMVFAQDINQATDLYNNGAMELEMGNKESALNYFQSAITEAEALGEAGAEIISNCQMMIPAVTLSLANDFIEVENYDAAMEWLAKAEEVAKLYGDTETAEKAADKKGQVLMKKASDLLKAKDYANAITVYEQIMAAEPTNGRAALQMGQAYNASGNQEKAEEAFNIAAANGQEKQAYKQLSNLYVKKASAALKAKQTQEAYDFAIKANEYLENANAYKLAASAAQKMGNNAKCIEFYEKYLVVKPNAKDAAGVTFTIAALYQQMGNKAKAIENYEKVASDPQYGAGAQEQLKVLKK